MIAGPDNGSWLQGNECCMALLPNPHHSLKLEWMRQVTPVDYEIEMPGYRKQRRVYHINLLKKWYAPSLALLAVNSQEAEEEMEIPVWENDSELMENLYPLEGQLDQDIEGCGADLPVEKRKQLLPNSLFQEGAG